MLLFGTLILHEPVRGRTIIAAILSLVGAILVTDPFTTQSANLAGVLLAFTAAVIAAVAYTTLRALATQVNFLASVLSFGVFTLSVGLLAGGGRDLMTNVSNTGIAMVAGILAFCAQCSISKGYEYCTAGKGALIRNIELPMAYIVGVVFLDEVPQIVSLLGGFLILVATLIIGYDAIENERMTSTQQDSDTV